MKRRTLGCSYMPQMGLNKILLRTVDTDVIVIGISMAQHIGCDSLCFAFGTGTSPTFRYLDAPAMAQALGDAKCGGFTAFHALTGCDVTSSFANHLDSMVCI